MSEWNFPEPEPVGYINGVSVPAGTNFVDAVSQVARNLHLASAHIKVNGEEVTPANAPSVVEDGDQISLEPYDKAA